MYSPVVVAAALFHQTSPGNRKVLFNPERSLNHTKCTLKGAQVYTSERKTKGGNVGRKHAIWYSASRFSAFTTLTAFY